MTIQQKIERRWPLTFFLFYTFIFHGTGSAIITGGIEFAVAYGMYRHPKNYDVVKMWGFPYTLAGDLVVTIFVQNIATWFIEEIIVGGDWFQNNSCHCPFGKNINKGLLEIWLEVKRCTILPVNQIDDKLILQYKNPISLFWLGVKLLLFRNPNHRDNKTLKYDFKNLCVWAINKLIRAILISVAIFIVVWPVTLGIITTSAKHRIPHDYIYNSYPFPQVLKLIFGAVVAFISTPIMVITIILRNDNYLKLVKSGELTDSLFKSASSNETQDENHDNGHDSETEEV
ncbi:hypothetical protein RI543_000050 [Arxiozyma heterogenica]|uniref:YHL026C-like protein n=1 Tax=Arxiozyma heterogenica TaxID=278026 RepID=A0AAN7W6R9_9SACH|nr:hypothetical protein RI543_000050 [Kazachstania heterogenica]